MFIYDLLNEGNEGPLDPKQFRNDDPRYSPEEDGTALKLSDTRKTRLTLQHLNKLRLMSEVRLIEKQEKVKAVKIQYAAPPADQGGGMGF